MYIVVQHSNISKVQEQAGTEDRPPTIMNCHKKLNSIVKTIQDFTQKS